VSGVSSVGFSTVRLLVAIAGASLWLTMLSGWLNGVIAEMTPSSGVRVVKILRALPLGEMSQEKISPSSLMVSWPRKTRRRRRGSPRRANPSSTGRILR
jgi:hypothetical protein